MAKPDRGWWRAHFEPAAEKPKQTCMLCGDVMDSRGGRPQKHLKGHGLTPQGKVEGGVPVPPAVFVEPPEEAPAEEVLEASLSGLSRDERLANLLQIANSKDTSDRDKVAAEGLIAKYQGFLDKPPEVDEEQEKEKHVERYRKKLVRRRQMESELQKFFRDREAKLWVLRQMVQTQEDVEWVRAYLDMAS